MREPGLYRVLNRIPRWVPYASATVMLLATGFVSLTGPVTVLQVAYDVWVTALGFTSAYVVDRKQIKARRAARELYERAKQETGSLEAVLEPDRTTNRDLSSDDVKREVTMAAAALASVLRYEDWPLDPSDDQLRELSDESAPLRKGPEPPKNALNGKLNLFRLLVYQLPRVN